MVGEQEQTFQETAPKITREQKTKFMDYENRYEERLVKTQKFTLEIEITGDEAEFADFEQLGESLMALTSQVLRMTDTRRFRFMWTAFLKPMPQRSNKTHADVQLPQVKENGVVKEHCAR